MVPTIEGALLVAIRRARPLRRLRKLRLLRLLAHHRPFGVNWKCLHKLCRVSTRSLLTSLQAPEPRQQQGK